MISPDDNPDTVESKSESASIVKADLLTRVLRDVDNRKLRSHNVWKLILDSSVGAVAREETHRSLFSPLYVKLQDIYEPLSADEQTTSTIAMQQILDLLSSEMHNQELPPHWQPPLGSSACVLCGEELDLQKAHKHMRKCAKASALVQATIAFESYLATLLEKYKWDKSRGNKVKECQFNPS